MIPKSIFKGVIKNKKQFRKAKPGKPFTRSFQRSAPSLRRLQEMRNFFRHLSPAEVGFLGIDPVDSPRAVFSVFFFFSNPPVSRVFFCCVGSMIASVLSVRVWVIFAAFSLCFCLLCFVSFCRRKKTPQETTSFAFIGGFA